MWTSDHRYHMIVCTINDGYVVGATTCNVNLVRDWVDRDSGRLSTDCDRSRLVRGSIYYRKNARIVFIKGIDISYVDLVPNFIDGDIMRINTRLDNRVD